MPAIVSNESCIGLWEQQLDDATNQLTIKSAAFLKEKASFEDLCNWILQLETCLDSMDATDDKRNDIINLLDLFVSQSENVCENITCLKEGVEILYCDIIQTSRCIEELKGKVEQLKNEVDALPKSVSNENSSFYTCLIKLHDQIEKVQDMFKDMITQILDLATTVYLIECLLCDPQTGLLNKLNDLVSDLGGDVNEEYCSNDDDSIPTNGKSLCTEKLDCPEFPLADEDFYSDTKSTLTQAESAKNTCKEKLDELTKDKDKLQACKTSLEKAIEEATKASEAK